MGPPPNRSHPYAFCAPEHDAEVWPVGVPPRRSVVVCSSARTGSTLLAEAIHERGLPCPVEYLNPDFATEFAARWGCSTPREYVRALWRHRTSADGTLAIKLHGAHLDFFDRPASAFGSPRPGSSDGSACDRDDRLFSNLVDAFPGATFVFLSRSDKVAQAVSFWLAEATGVWESRDEGPGADHPAADAYDFRSINAKRHLCIEEAESWEFFFARNELDPIRLTYEELALDIAGVVNALAPVLGLEPNGAAPSLVRQAGPRSDELCRRFTADLAVVEGRSAGDRGRLHALRG